MSKKNIKFPGYIILASLLNYKLWKSQNTKCTCIMDRNLLLCSNTTCNLFICLKYPPPPKPAYKIIPWTPSGKTF